MRVKVSEETVKVLEEGIEEFLRPKLDFIPDDDYECLELEVEDVLMPPQEDEEVVEVSERDFNNLVNALRKYRHKELGSPKSELTLATESYSFISTVRGASRTSVLPQDLLEKLNTQSLKRCTKPTSFALQDISFWKTLNNVIRAVNDAQSPNETDLLMKEMAEKYLGKNSVKDSSLAWVAGLRASLSLYVLSQHILSR